MHGKVSTYILLFAISMILLSLGLVWVITNIFAILKVVVPVAILASAIAGGILGYKLKTWQVRRALN